MTVLNLKHRSLTVVTGCTYNLTEICPICIRGELSVELTVFNLEGRSFTVLTLRRLAGIVCILAFADPPVAVLTDVRSLTVCAGRLNLKIGFTDPPVAVCTNVRNLTLSLYACVGVADEPVAVITNGRSETVCTLCLNAEVGIADPPVAILNIRSFAIGSNSLVSGILTVEVPVAVLADVVVKSAADADHTVACVLKEISSACEVGLVFASEVNLSLVNVAGEYFLSAGYKDKLCINVCISVLSVADKKRPLNVAVYTCCSDCTTVYSELNAFGYLSRGSIADSDCREAVRLVESRVVHTGKVRIIDSDYSIVTCNINCCITADSAVIYSDVAAYGGSRNVKSVLKSFRLNVINCKGCRLLNNVDCTLGVRSTYDSEVLDTNRACKVHIDRASSRGSKGVSVTVKDDLLVENESCIESYVCDKNDCVACLCCSVSLCDRCIANAVYGSNSLYDAVRAVTVRSTSHTVYAVLGNIALEGTAGDCGSCGKFAAGPSANPNVTVEGTAGYRSCKCACSINAGEVGRTVYNNVAADCNLHTACITVAVEINCFNACRVFGNLTAGDIKLTLVSRGVRILKPNLTYDLAAADIDNVIVSSAVCKSTDRAALSCCDCTALNVENCIATVSVGKVVNSELVNVCSSGKALNSTTLDGESSLLVGDCGNCISPSSVSSTVEVVRNLTAAYAIKDSEVAVIFNKSIVLSDLRGNSLAESVAVKIKNDILVDNKSLVKSNVALENDCITVLCRLKRGLDRILAYVVNCGGVRGTSILRHCGEKTYALCAACKLIGVAAVVIVICGVEVVEYTAGNVNLTENALSLVNVKEESHTIVELLSLVATALNVNDTAASCIDCCATVGYEDTVLNSNNRAVDRGNYLNVLAVACCKHSAVTCDSKLRAVLSEDNLNYVSVKACCYCATCKVESYVNITVKNNARVKLNVLNESDYVACLCRVDSSLDAGVLNATDLNCRNESVNVRVNVAVTTAGASMCSVTSVCEVRRSYNRIVVMTGSLDNNSFSRKLVAASRAVNYALVVTCYCTGCLNSVLFNCRSRSVNVNNDTVGSVAVCLTIEAVCKILGNVGSEGTAGDCVIINITLNNTDNIRCTGDGNGDVIVSVRAHIDCLVAALDCTAGYSESTKIKRGCVCDLTPDTSAIALDVTTVYGEVCNAVTGIAVKSGICHTHTNCSVCTGNATTVDNHICITEAVCTVIKSDCHCCAAQVSECTAFNGKVTAAVKNNCGLCVPATIICSGKIYSTVLNSKITVVIEYYEVAGRIIGNVDGMTTEIKSNLVVLCEIEQAVCCVVVIACKIEIAKKSDCRAVLCCVNCFLKSLILCFTDLCYCNESVNIRVNVGVATVRAGVSSITLCIKCRRSYNCAVVMSCCGNNLLCNGFAVTSRAVRAFGKTCAFTSGSNSLVNHDIVTESVNSEGRCYCVGCYAACLVDVLYVSTKANVTSGTMLVSFNAICGTGCGNLGYGLEEVTESRYVVAGVCITASTSVCCITVCKTSGIFHAFTVVMNVNNDTVGSVVVCLTIEAVCKILGNIGSECTAGDLKSSLAVLIGLVNVYNTVDMTTGNVADTTYDALVAGKIIVPIIDAKRCIFFTVGAIYDVATLNVEDTVNTNSYLLLCCDSTVTYESNSLVDTNVEERIACVIVISLCGRNCIIAKINSEVTSNLAVVSSLNVDILGNLDVREKNYCIAVLRRIKSCLKCFVPGFADLRYCNESVGVIAIFGFAAVVSTVVNCVTLCIEGRSNYLACYHIMSGCGDLGL